MDTPVEVAKTARKDSYEMTVTDGVSPLHPITNPHRESDVSSPEVHLMIVEDNALSRKMMSIFLRRNGFYVHSFGTSTEALGWAAFASPSAILLDVMLPDISGLDLFEQLHAMPHLEKIPIIFVTAFQSEKAEQECLQRGAAGFFTKPAYLPSIAACISRTLHL